MGINNGSRVAAAKPKVGGGLYFAPLGTALPTDATTPLAAAFKALGPISQDGVRPSRDTSVEKVREWDGSTLASLLTDESRTFEVLLYGVHDVDALGFLFSDDNVTVTAASTTSGTKISIADKGGKPGKGALVIEMAHEGVKQRKVVPVADPTVTGEEPYVAGGLRGYTVEVEATKHDSGPSTYECAELNHKAAA